MASRARTILRASIAAGVVIIAVAAFVRPFRPEETARPRPVQQPRSREVVTPEGLVAVDSGALFDRMRASRAKGIVVGMWASWCGSCKDDVPLLIGLRKDFGADIDVMLVSVDEPEERPVAAEMLQGFGAPRPNFVVTEDLGAFKRAIDPRWPGMLPATFLFDRSAKVHYFWAGPVLETEIVPLLRRYLAGENVDGMSDFALAPGATTKPE